MARKMKANMQRLLDERDRLLAEMDALKHKISGLELAISLFEREENDQPKRATSERGKTKELLIDLLRDVGTTGLNARSAVEVAARRGVTLARGTAASTLSRLKRDGVAVYDGDRYRLKDLARPKPATVANGGGTVSGVAAMAAAGTLRASSG
jgi:hypothetical protein